MIEWLGLAGPIEAKVIDKGVWLLLIVFLPALTGILALHRPPRRPGHILLGLTPIAIAWGGFTQHLSVSGEGLLVLTLSNIELVLRVNGLAVVLLAITHGMATLLAIYACGMLNIIPPTERQAKAFWSMLGALITALSVIWVAVDLLTLYLALEAMGLAAVGMLLVSGRQAALVAGMRYLLLALVGSLMYLLGVALIFGQWGTLSMVTLATVITPGPVTGGAAALLGAGLALKAALFPLHAWLAPVHGSAWTPVSAVHAALVVKASLFILLMLWSLLLPPGSWLPVVLSVCGSIAIVWGGLLAWRTHSLKQLVAASTIAQLGYLMLVFPLLLNSDLPARTQQLAWEGFWLHLLGHALAKAAMFMAAGNLIVATGESSLTGLAGSSRRLPLSLLVFGLSSVSLMGLPPSAGFTAKWQLLQAFIANENIGAIAVLLCGSLLTAAYVFRLFRYSFVESAPQHDVQPLAPGMNSVALLLALLALALGLWAEWPLSLLRGGEF